MSVNNNIIFEIKVQTKFKGVVEFSVNENMTGEQIKNMILDYFEMPRESIMIKIERWEKGGLLLDKTLKEQGVTEGNNKIYFTGV